MNMVRIRRIMEMRKELKAPPLLPPKVKRGSIDSIDRKTGPRDIIIFHFQLRNTRLSPSLNLVLSIYESEGGGISGPWKLSTTSESFNTINSVIDLPSVFSIEFEFEIQQPLRIELCILNEDSLQSYGYTVFTVSHLINSRRLTRPLISEMDGKCISTIDISSSIKHRSPPILLQFEGREFHRKFVTDNGILFLIVIDTKEDKELYRSEGNRIAPIVLWKQFTIKIDDDKKIIEISVICRDERTRIDILIGRIHTTLYHLQRDQLQSPPLQLTNIEYKDGKRGTGILEIIRSSPIILSSFLDYITTGSTIHLSFAIDFSSNEDDTLSPSIFNDVEFIIRSIGDTCSEYTSRSISAYGFAARIPPLNRESQQFCLNLETNASIESIYGVIEALRFVTSHILPSKNAHLSHIIYHVSKLALNVNLRRDPNNTQYFILVILTTGVIDDIKESLQAVIFASKAPISIIFIGMGDKNKDDIERMGRGGTRLMYQGRKVVRDIVHYVDVNSINREDKVEDAMMNLSESALYRIPQQMTTYLSRSVSSQRMSSGVMKQQRGYGSMVSIDINNEDGDGESFDYSDRRPRATSSSRTSLHVEYSDDSGYVDSSIYKRSKSPHFGGDRPRPIVHLSRDMRSMSISNDIEQLRAGGRRRPRTEYPA